MVGGLLFSDPETSLKTASSCRGHANRTWITMGVI